MPKGDFVKKGNAQLVADKAAKKEADKKTFEEKKKENLLKEPIRTNGSSITLDYDLLLEKFDKYIMETDYPIIKEFCVKEGYSYDTIEDLKRKLPALAQTIKRALQKAESYIERNALHNKVNPVFSMFRLKQPCFGWTDKQEIAINKEPTKISLDELDKLEKEADKLENKGENQ